ncbi:protease propeptide/inhibitor [Irpex rosettiformis]|uniref:Protease propeptide/inhibitor n=1 Tax=Irpex rosettiformis TaxID=378272 RepID=A0ACB8U104_9APHY|nr:protease propeptide/inhibitor [Irpex rosettiformis]
MSGKYIVVFKKDATADQIEKYASDVNTNGGKVKDIWKSGLKGFSAEIPTQYLTTLQSFVDNGPIDYIEEDSVVTTQ